MRDPNAQVPSPDEIIGPGIDKLVELRPGTLRHINYGRGVYSHIFAGWRAQAALMVRRLADYAKNGRLAFAGGDALKILTGSEFDTLSDLAPASAVGQVVLTRGGGRDGGTIRKGARFRRPADTSSQRLYADAAYQCAVDTFVAQGATSATVPLVAARAGTFANRPSTGATQTELEIADDIFDRTAWTVASYEMGGGSDGGTDDDIRQYARAYAQGQYGPVARAAVAGAFRAGAKHVIAIDDVTTAALQLYIADASWAGSTRWAQSVRQSLRDAKLTGFGCKVLVTFATNEIIGVEAVCKVRSPAYLAETTAIDASIQAAVRKYFDGRLDWNNWKLSALRGVISRADRRLLACTSVTVKTPAGVTVPEPTAAAAKHYLLVNDSVRVTYQSPT